MGVKSEKKRLTSILGTDSGKLEFTENLFDNFAENKLPEDSKIAIKNVLTKKYEEFEIIASSKDDQYMRTCLAQFLNNVTYSDLYKRCVQEIKNNPRQINMANLFASIRNSDKNDKKRRK